MPENVLEQLSNAIMELNDQKSKDIARKGIEGGIDPLAMINEGIRSALDVMGERFSAGDLFLPELMLSAKAADAAVEILEPELLKKGSPGNKLGKILIATVKGDIHDIGKNIVALLMKSAGFEVVDIGVDRTDEEILVAAKENSADVIGLSALLTTTLSRMEEFIAYLQESGFREQYKVIVGGAPVTQAYSDQIGADGYGSDATRAVEITKNLIS